MHLTLAQFRSACKAYVTFYDSKDRVASEAPDHGAGEEALGPHLCAQGWSWKEDPHFPRTAHLFRSFELLDLRSPKPSKEVTDELLAAEMHVVEEDSEGAPSIVAGPSPSVIRVQQSITYSSTWRVPVLHFNAYNADDGIPLSLDALLESPVMVRSQASTLTAHSLQQLAVDGDASNPDTDEEAPAVFPTISSGEHPHTSRPSYFLHPCETAACIDATSNLSASTASDLSSEQLVSYLETFIMLCASAVEMRT